MEHTSSHVLQIQDDEFFVKIIFLIFILPILCNISLIHVFIVLLLNKLNPVQVAAELWIKRSICHAESPMNKR